jgi:hypothetical protein
MHNFAPTRHLVWARLESFADQVLTLRRLTAAVPEAVQAG